MIMGVCRCSVLPLAKVLVEAVLYHLHELAGLVVRVYVRNGVRSCMCCLSGG